MKINISKDADWQEIKNAVAPVLQNMVIDGMLSKDERESASETIVTAFIQAKNNPNTQTGHTFNFDFSAIADFQTGAFQLYKRVG